MCETVALKKKRPTQSTQTLRQLTGRELTFQTQFATAVRAEPRGMCLLCVARVSLYQKYQSFTWSSEGTSPTSNILCMGNQALPERLKTTTTKSERLGWTEGRRGEQTNILMLTEHFRKKK